MGSFWGPAVLSLDLSSLERTRGRVQSPSGLSCYKWYILGKSHALWVYFLTWKLRILYDTCPPSQPPTMLQSLLESRALEPTSQPTPAFQNQATPFFELCSLLPINHEPPDLSELSYRGGGCHQPPRRLSSAHLLHLTLSGLLFPTGPCGSSSLRRISSSRSATATIIYRIFTFSEAKILSSWCKTVGAFALFPHVQKAPKVRG